MINLLFGFIFGFASCLALWLRREVERARVFDALDRQSEMLRRREREIVAVLLRIRGEAKEMRRVLELGGPVALPSVAMNAGRAHHANGKRAAII